MKQYVMAFLGADGTVLHVHEQDTPPKEDMVDDDRIAERVDMVIEIDPETDTRLLARDLLDSMRSTGFPPNGSVEVRDADQFEETRDFPKSRYGKAKMDRIKGVSK